MAACAAPGPAGPAGRRPLPASGLVLDHAWVVGPSGGRDGAVVVEGDRIWGVVQAGRSWPEGLEVHDLQGAAVMPGLVDAHVHLYYSGATWWVGDTVAANLRAELAWGVVGAIDVGGPVAMTALRDRIERGELLGPRLAVTGPFLTAEGSHPCERVNDRDLCTFVDGDGARRAGELAAAGVDALKVALVDNAFTGDPVPRLDTGDLAAIAGAGLPVFAHVADNADALDAFDAGASVLAHPVFASPVLPEVAGLPVDAVESTWMAFEGVVELTGGAELDGPDFVALPDAVRAAWRYVQAHPEVLQPGWAEDSAGWADQLLVNLSALREAGAPVVAGSDSGYWFVPHGVALHREMEALVAAGWTEGEAIAAATVLPARLAGWDDLGRIEAGCRADLLVVDGDPLSDIAATREIRALVLDGRWLERRELLRIDPWVSRGQGFCLDDRDCPGQRCDLVDHACTAACEPAWSALNDCGKSAWCMPADGLDGPGACHEGDGCDWRSQDCQPASYAETCLPEDLDTGACWPSGPRGPGESCGWYDPDELCAPGLLCTTAGRCQALCEPGTDCASGPCQAVWAAPGVPWYGLCPTPRRARGGGPAPATGRSR